MSFSTHNVAGFTLMVCCCVEATTNSRPKHPFKKGEINKWIKLKTKNWNIIGPKITRVQNCGDATGPKATQIATGPKITKMLVWFVATL